MQDDFDQEAESILTPSLLDVVTQRLDEANYESITRTLLVGENDRQSSSQHVTSTLNDLLAETSLPITGLYIIVHDTTTVAYLETTAEDTRVLIKALRIVSSLDDTPHRCLTELFVKKFSPNAKESVVEMDAVDVTKIVIDLHLKLSAMLDECSEMNEVRVTTCG